MKPFVLTLALVTLTSLPALAQNSTSVAAPTFWPPFAEKSGFQAQDNSAPIADQPAKPAEPKGSTTLIGCLSGPGSDGRFTLRSMSHRTGVEVFGPEGLKDDSGSKVRLTGSWKPGDQPAVKGKETRKFQAADIEVLAQKCEAPSEKTPVSKEKQQKQQQKQKSSTSGDAANPE